MTFQEIRHKLRSVERVGNQYRAKCPSHADSTPSLTVRRKGDRVLFHCHAGCETQDIIQALGLSWEDCFLGDDTPKKPKERTPPMDKSVSDLDRDLHDKIIQYLVEKRGLSKKSIRDNYICQSKNVYFRDLDQETWGIGFPYIKGNKVKNIKWRGKNKSFTQTRGGTSLFFGFQKLQNNPNSIVITEGEIDALTVDSADIDIPAISVPNGASKNNFNFLEPAKKYMDQVEEIYLALDKDEPGETFEQELARRLGRERCYICQYPSDCKDINDVIREYGPEKVVEVIQEARPYPITGVYTPTDLKDELKDLYEEGYEQGYSTGWPKVDKLYSVKEGELTVITGNPNSGKSAWLNALCVNLAKHHGMNLGVCPFETLPLRRQAQYMIEIWGGKPIITDDKEKRMSRSALKKHRNEMSKYINFILPEAGEMTVENILELAKACVYRRGIKGLAIDPWNAIDHDRASEGNHQYIGTMLNRIRRFARDNSIHIWIVAHPIKPDSSDDNPERGAYDISGSSNWNNKADNVISIWRDLDHNQNKIKVMLKKVRFQETGQLGETELEYNPHTKRFREAMQGVSHERNDSVDAQQQEF